MMRAPFDHDDARRREMAGALLQMALDLRHLPPFLHGEPGGMAASLAAHRVAPAFLEELAVIYGVRRWSPEEYERAYLRGALAGWQPGVRIERRGARLRILSPICPMAAEAEVDPRACQFCRAFQAEVARAAAGAEAHHEDLISRGDGSCIAEVQLPAKPGD